MFTGHLYNLFCTVFNHIFCPLFLIGLFVFYYWFIGMIYKVYSGNQVLWCMYWEYFVPVYALPIHFLNGLFWWAKIFNFDEVKFNKFFSFVFCIPWKKSLLIPNNKDISEYFLPKVSELAFMFRSKTHLKLNFLCMLPGSS